MNRIVATALAWETSALRVDCQDQLRASLEESYMVPVQAWSLHCGGRNEVSAREVINVLQRCGCQDVTATILSTALCGLGKAVVREGDMIQYEDYIQVLPELCVGCGYDRASDVGSSSDGVVDAVVQVQREATLRCDLAMALQQLQSAKDTITSLKGQAAHLEESLSEKRDEVSSLRRRMEALATESRGRSMLSSSAVLCALFGEGIPCPQCHMDITASLSATLGPRLVSTLEHAPPSQWSSAVMELPVAAFALWTLTCDLPSELEVCCHAVGYVYHHADTLDVLSIRTVLDAVRFAWVPARHIELMLRGYDKYAVAPMECACRGVAATHTTVCSSVRDRLIAAARYKVCVLSKDPMCLDMPVFTKPRPGYSFLKGTALHDEDATNIDVCAKMQQLCDAS